MASTTTSSNRSCSRSFRAYPAVANHATLPAFFHKTRDTPRESENIPGRVHVAVVACAAVGTIPFSYSKACDTFRPLRRQCSARRTGLGRELLVHFRERRRLVAQHVAE